jgi:hypothetical protein
MSFSCNTLPELQQGVHDTMQWLESIDIRTKGTRIEQIDTKLAELDLEAREFPPRELDEGVGRQPFLLCARIGN